MIQLGPYEQLEKFVEAARRADPDHLIMERLASICEVDPLRSARIVGIMVEGDDEGWRVLIPDGIDVVLCANDGFRSAAQSCVR